MDLEQSVWRLRAKRLESEGYETQVLEFIDMEHTPKNILIRAVKKQGMRYQNKNQASVEQLEAFLQVKPTLDKLLHS